MAVSSLHNFFLRKYPVLATWLALGLSWFLLGMMFLSSSKLYHQGLILLFWLPGLAAWLPQIRACLCWDNWLLFGLASCIVWALLSVSWGGDFSLYKEMLYVVLSVQAFVVLASLCREKFWRLLACLALVGSLGGVGAIVDFYFLQKHASYERLIGTGLLNHPILAAHIFGCMGLILFILRRDLPGILQGWIWLLACVFYFISLVLTLSKGPLLAFLAAFLILPVCAPNVRYILFAALLVIVAALGVFMYPDFILRGGMSYRPDLLQGAWELFLQRPWQGCGVGCHYELSVAELGVSFEHAHNFFAHILLQLGVPGLLLWLAVLLVALWRGWSSRLSPAGLMLCCLLGFAVVALMTDGIGPWVKPREEWFTVWLPIFLCFALRASWADGRSNPE